MMSHFQEESEGLTAYLNGLAKTKPLEYVEEAELAEKIRKGDREALNALVKANLRFVVNIASKYRNQGLDFADLISAGNMGLLKAAKKFDETKKFKFISYAVWYIRQSILQSLAENSRIVSIPLNQIPNINKIKNIKNKYANRYGRDPDIDELVRESKLSKDNILVLLGVSQKVIPFDRPLHYDGSDGSLLDHFVDEETENTDEFVRNVIVNEVAEKALAALSKKEQMIMKLYFGFKNKVPLTLKEIGLEFGISRERVRQLKERALEYLRSGEISKKLKKRLESKEND
jgi:RNA polymerase primary sigma factor